MYNIYDIFIYIFIYFKQKYLLSVFVILKLYNNMIYKKYLYNIEMFIINHTNKYIFKYIWKLTFIYL